MTDTERSARSALRQARRLGERWSSLHSLARYRLATTARSVELTRWIVGEESTPLVQRFTW